MPLRDEKTFTDEEWIAAFALVLPPDRAREEGIGLNSLPDLHDPEGATAEDLKAAGANGPRSYDSDLLDLISLVSDSCAERAWRLLKVTREEGERHREAMRQRVEEAQRYRQ